MCTGQEIGPPESVPSSTGPLGPWTRIERTGGQSGAWERRNGSGNWRGRWDGRGVKAHRTGVEAEGESKLRPIAPVATLVKPARIQLVTDHPQRNHPYFHTEDLQSRNVSPKAIAAYADLLVGLLKHMGNDQAPDLCASR